VNDIDGIFSLANFNMAFPKGEHADTGVTALKLTQRLFDHLLRNRKRKKPGLQQTDPSGLRCLYDDNQ
jgi:hypothetical protein